VFDFCLMDEDCVFGLGLCFDSDTSFLVTFYDSNRLTAEVFEPKPVSDQREI